MDRRLLLEIQRDDLRALLVQENAARLVCPRSAQQKWLYLNASHWPINQKTRLTGTLLLIESELQELRK